MEFQKESIYKWNNKRKNNVTQREREFPGVYSSLEERWKAKAQMKFSPAAASLGGGGGCVH